MLFLWCVLKKPGKKHNRWIQTDVHFVVLRDVCCMYEYVERNAGKLGLATLGQLFFYKKRAPLKVLRKYADFKDIGKNCTK